MQTVEAMPGQTGYNGAPFRAVLITADIASLPFPLDSAAANCDTTKRVQGDGLEPRYA